MANSHKRFTLSFYRVILIVVIVLVLLLLVGFWNNGQILYRLVILHPVPCQGCIGPATQPIPTSKVDTTANWTLHTSENFHYSFKYPSSFTIFNPYMGVMLVRGLYPEISLTIPDGKSRDGSVWIRVLNQLPPSQNNPSNYPTYFANQHYTLEKSLIPSDLQLLPGITDIAYVTSVTDNGTKYYLYHTEFYLPKVHFLDKDSTAEISFQCADPGMVGQCKLLLPQILSTLKFTQ